MYRKISVLNCTSKTVSWSIRLHAITLKTEAVQQAEHRFLKSVVSNQHNTDLGILFHLNTQLDHYGDYRDFVKSFVCSTTGDIVLL